MSNEVKTTTFENTKLNTVKLDWKEVYYTNCPLVSASNVDEGLGLDQKGIQEDRRELSLPAFHARKRLVSALHPQHGQPDPLRRTVPAHRRPRKPRRDLPSGCHADAGRRRCDDGACWRRHLPDVRSERQEDRSLQEHEPDQERLVAHSGAPGDRTHAPDERHDHGRHRARRVSLCRRLVQRSEDGGT